MAFTFLHPSLHNLSYFFLPPLHTPLQWSPTSSKEFKVSPIRPHLHFYLNILPSVTFPTFSCLLYTFRCTEAQRTANNFKFLQFVSTCRFHFYILPSVTFPTFIASSAHSATLITEEQNRVSCIHYSWREKRTSETPKKESALCGWQVWEGCLALVW